MEVEDIIGNIESENENDLVDKKRERLSEIILEVKARNT